MHMAAFYNPGADGGIEVSTEEPSTGRCTDSYPQLTERCPAVNAPGARYPFKVRFLESNGSITPGSSNIGHPAPRRY